MLPPVSYSGSLPMKITKLFLFQQTSLLLWVWNQRGTPRHCQCCSVPGTTSPCPWAGGKAWSMSRGSTYCWVSPEWHWPFQRKMKPTTSTANQNCLLSTFQLGLIAPLRWWPGHAGMLKDQTGCAMQESNITRASRSALQGCNSCSLLSQDYRLQTEEK